MPYRRRNTNTKRKYRKAKGKKPMKALVAKYVDRALQNKAETKFFTYSTSQSFGLNGIVSWNLFYEGTSRGTGDNDLIGNKIFWKGLNLHYNLTNKVSGSNWNTQPFKARIMILSTKKYVALASLTLLDIRDNTTGNVHLWYPEADVTIHAQKIVKMNTDRYYPTGLTSTQKNVSGTMNFRANRRIQYKEYSLSQELVGRNYYLVVQVLAQGTDFPTSGETGTLEFAWKNYFKDM